jgi:hypothetical protein
MRTVLATFILGTLTAVCGCSSEEKPMGKAPEVKPENSGAGPPPEVKKGGRIPAAPKQP